MTPNQKMMLLLFVAYIFAVLVLVGVFYNFYSYVG